MIKKWLQQLPLTDEDCCVFGTDLSAAAAYDVLILGREFVVFVCCE